MAPYWVRSLPAHWTPPTIFIFAISLRGWGVASQDPCNCGVYTVPGVPNGALGGVPEGCRRGLGKVSIELRRRDGGGLINASAHLIPLLEELFPHCS